jgi:stress-induced morphogen
MENHLKELLQTVFNPTHLEVVNESGNHSGNREDSHFKIVVVSDDFEDVSLINRHRKINELFKEELQEIHALAMHTYTPSEWELKSEAPHLQTVVAVVNKMQKLVVIVFILFLHSCVKNITVIDNNTKKNNETYSKSVKKEQNLSKSIKTANLKKHKVYQNLWDEITDNLTLYEYTKKDIFWHTKWFMENPQYLTRVSKRAKLYLKLVLDEVKKQGLPYEIALLPIIESAYYPFAYSHGTASGIWQFIPSTGKLYGLKQDFWIDERRDPIRSTKAAIAYLKSLHKIL